MVAATARQQASRAGRAGLPEQALPYQATKAALEAAGPPASQPEPEAAVPTASKLEVQAASPRASKAEVLVRRFPVA